jgi:hypothetical protein
MTPGQVVLGEPVGRDDVRVVGRADGREVVHLVRHLPDLGHGIALRLRERVLRRRLDGLVVLGERPVDEGPEEAAHEVGPHDERLVAVLGVGRERRVEIGHVEPDPLALLVGLGAGTLGSHQMSFFRSLHGLPPRSARRGCRGCAGWRPREAPAVAQRVLLVGGLAPIGLVEELAVGPSTITPV